MEAIAPAVYGPMPGIRRKASMEEGMEPLCSDITSASLGVESLPLNACGGTGRLYKYFPNWVSLTFQWLFAIKLREGLAKMFHFWGGCCFFNRKRYPRKRRLHHPSPPTLTTLKPTRFNHFAETFPKKNHQTPWDVPKNPHHLSKGF